MADAAQDHQPATSMPKQRQSPELRRFEAIEMSIPVPLRPRDAPIPLTNLSTGENGRLDRIHRETEGRPPSERMADAYFADEFMRILKHRDVEFLQEAFIHLSKDKKYGYIVGPTDFLGGHSETRLLCVLSLSKLGRRVYGYYRRADVELEPLGLTEKQRLRLPEGFLNQYDGKEIPCIGIVFDRFTERGRTAVTEAAFTLSQQTDPTDLASSRSSTIQKAKTIQEASSDSGEAHAPAIQYISDSSNAEDACTTARQDEEKFDTPPASHGNSSSSTFTEFPVAQGPNVDRKGKGRAVGLHRAANAVPKQGLEAEDVYKRAQQLVYDEEVARRLAAAEDPLSQKEIDSLIGLEQVSVQQGSGATEYSIISRSSSLRPGDQTIPNDAGSQSRDTNDRLEGGHLSEEAPTLSDAAAGPSTPAARAKRPRTSPPSGESQKPAAKISRIESEDDGSPHPRHLGRRDRQLDSRSSTSVNGGGQSQINPRVGARPPSPSSTFIPSRYIRPSSQSDARESLQEAVLSGIRDGDGVQGISRYSGIVSPVSSAAAANAGSLPHNPLESISIIRQDTVAEDSANSPRSITTTHPQLDPRNGASLRDRLPPIPHLLTVTDSNRPPSPIPGAIPPPPGPSGQTINPVPLIDGAAILRGLRAALMLVDSQILSRVGIELSSPGNEPQTNEDVNASPHSSTDSSLFELLRAARSTMATVPPEALSTIGIRIIAPRTRFSTGSGASPIATRGSGGQASTTGHYQPASGSNSSSKAESGRSGRTMGQSDQPAGRQRGPNSLATSTNGGQNQTVSAPTPTTPSQYQVHPHQAREKTESPSGAMDWAPFAQEEITKLQSDKERPDNAIHPDPQSPTVPARRVSTTKAVNSVPDPANSPSFAPIPLGRNNATGSETRGRRREALNDLMDIEMGAAIEEKTPNEAGQGGEIEDASLSNNLSGEALPSSGRSAEQLRRPRSVQDERRESSARTIRAVRSQPRMDEVHAKKSNRRSAKENKSSSSQEPRNSDNARVLTTPGADPSQVVTNQTTHGPGSESVGLPKVVEQTPAAESNSTIPPDGQAITATATATTAPPHTNGPPGREVGGLAHSIGRLDLTRTRGSSPMDTSGEGY